MDEQTAGQEDVVHRFAMGCCAFLLGKINEHSLENSLQWVGIPIQQSLFLIEPCLARHVCTNGFLRPQQRNTKQCHWVKTQHLRSPSPWANGTLGDLSGTLGDPRGLLGCWHPMSTELQRSPVLSTR